MHNLVRLVWGDRTSPDLRARPPAPAAPAAGGGNPACRAILVIQSGPFNASRLNTTIAAVITSKTALAAMPGNVFVPAAVTGLPKDSVVNVTALVTLDKADLGEPSGQLPESLLTDVSRGLRRVFGL